MQTQTGRQHSAVVIVPSVCGLLLLINQGTNFVYAATFDIHQQNIKVSFDASTNSLYDNYIDKKEAPGVVVFNIIILTRSLLSDPGEGEKKNK